MREPTWLPRLVLDAAHVDQIREHGGAAGIQDDGLLESALARPRNKWSYDPKVDLPDLAAAYGFAIARNHPYLDGNKRAAFLAMAIFLGLNGREIDAPEAEVVAVMLGLASGKVGEPELAAWVRAHQRRSPRQEGG